MLYTVEESDSFDQTFDFQVLLDGQLFFQIHQNQCLNLHFKKSIKKRYFSLLKKNLIRKLKIPFLPSVRMQKCQCLYEMVHKMFSLKSPVTCRVTTSH